MISLRTTSGLKEAGAISIRTASGLKEVSEVWLRTATGLKQVFGQFSLSASPNTVSGSTSSHAPQRIVTNSTTVTPNPGGAVDSVSWSIDAGWDVLYPSSLTTTFRSPSVGPSDGSSATATCTVTRGGSTATVDVDASVSNFGT